MVEMAGLVGFYLDTYSWLFSDKLFFFLDLNLKSFKFLYYRSLKTVKSSRKLKNFKEKKINKQQMGYRIIKYP